MKKPLTAELTVTVNRKCVCLGGHVETPAGSPQSGWALHTRRDPFSLSHGMAGDKLSSGPSFTPAREAATCHGHCHTCSPGLGARESAMLHLPTGLYHLLSGPLP